MKNTILLFLMGFILSCNPRPKDSITEDYGKLFPFTGITRPDISYDDMTKRLCDPEQPLKLYKYPGVEIKNIKDYTVTLTCTFREGSETESKYEVRYIDESKEIKNLGNHSNENYSQKLENGITFTKKFKVKSGYPMYLLVNGVGTRGSSIEASIKAVSDDGLTIVPELGTKQFQNNEGPDKIENPYCNYIILP